MQRVNHHLRSTRRSLVTTAVANVLEPRLFLSGSMIDVPPAPLAEPASTMAVEVAAHEPTEEGAGNNLSFPVIWSDEARLALRGTFGSPEFNGAFTFLDGENWYHQQDELNTWQAGSADWSAAPVEVDWVDWGDNLEARDWRANRPVRVETVLYQDLATTLGSTLDARATPMDAFGMKVLFGQGPNEMQGTNADAAFTSEQATVYTGRARLTIQKLTKDRDDATLALTWNPATQQWTGDALAPAFSDAVGGSEGESGYSAEINVGGKAIFGYNWRPADAGDYRLTFSFDPGTTAPNIGFDADTGIVVSEEEADANVGAPGGGGPGGGEPGGGGTAVVDAANDITYIDVRIGQGGSPSLSINDVTQHEGNSGQTPFVFTVTRDGDTSGTSTVDYTTVYGNSVTSGADLAIQSGTVTFAPGEVTKEVTILVNGDTNVEQENLFYVELSNATGATIADGQGEGRIINDDGVQPTLPTLSIDDVTKNEGNSGQTPFVFTVTRSGNTTGSSTVKYTTVYGNSVTSAADLAIQSGTVTFAAGETSKQVTILVNGDTNVEQENLFYVDLSAATGATIADGRGVGRIVNDDGVQPSLPTLSINDVTKNEGNSGQTAFVFTITRSGSTTSSSTVKYKTVYGNSITSAEDLAFQSGTVTFAAGETSKQVTIFVNGDTKPEQQNLFYVDLSEPVGATILDSRGVGTIINDD